MKILVIEDDHAQATALCKLLSERMDDPARGVKVKYLIVGTLAEGRRVAVPFQANVTISDIVLPDATEQDVLDAINLLPPPVVIVSALIDDDPDLAARCWDHGAKGVLSKRGLLEKITTLDGIIQKARFIDAVTCSHLRATARSQIVKAQNGNLAPA